MPVTLIEFRKSLQALQHYPEDVDTFADLNDRARAALEAGRFLGPSDEHSNP
jgi:hypothetical protein